MSTSPIEFLAHIRDETNYLLDAREGVSRDAFLRDETLKRAFVRSAEIISAGAKALPEEFRERYPSIEWRALVAIDERLIHGCFGTDYEIIWDFVNSNVPQLKRQIDDVLQAEGSERPNV